ncbi:iron ABC transporter permease [Tistrella sp. BH-R2-4]|uniref:Iron ABC transporter permease n=1 Tax=Tistrella arctica TaxID=3133430 RepID=A0ABU9YLA3_9PROT
MHKSASDRILLVVMLALVVLFIAWPIGSMLIRSVQVPVPLSTARLADMTRAALAALPDDRGTTLRARWAAEAAPRPRMEAIAAAFTLNGLEVPWDRTAAFDRQIPAAEQALAGLAPDLRARVTGDLPLAVAMLHKRAVLVHLAGEALAPAMREALRSGQTTTMGIDHYSRVAREHRLRAAGLNALLLATTTTVITTMLAFLAAFGISRGLVVGAGLARFGLLVPLVSPPVVVATAAVLLFGRNGVVTHDLLDRTLGWTDAAHDNLYGLGGVLVAQVLSFLPAAFIVFDNLFTRPDGRLDEAAASAGASPWQRFRHVTLPMAQPGIVRAATLVFILSMTDFGNPMVIGRDLPVLAGVLYDEMIGFHNTAFAAAIAVWLIVPALAIALALNRIGGRRRFTSGFGGGDGGGNRQAAMAPPPALRRGFSLLVWSVIAATGVIYATIIAGAFVKVWGRDWGLTPHHFTAVEAVPGFVSSVVGITPVWTSLVVAGIAAPLGGLLAVIAAYLAERHRSTLTECMALIILLPAILPGVVFGIGYLTAFNAPFGIRALSLNGTHAVLVLNILFGNMFVGVLAGRALLRRIDRSIDEAAAALGASPVQRIRHVVLPVMRHAAILGALYVFVDGLSTVSAVVFLQGPDIGLAAVAILNAAEGTYYGAACAMSVAILIIVFTVMAAIRLVERGRLPARAAGTNPAAAMGAA